MWKSLGVPIGDWCFTTLREARSWLAALLDREHSLTAEGEPHAHSRIPAGHNLAESETKEVRPIHRRNRRTG